MYSFFSYVKYSEASFPMTGQYISLLLITLLIWIFLWFGYRNNKINDEHKEKLRKKILQDKNLRLEKLSRLYPENNQE